MTNKNRFSNEDDQEKLDSYLRGLEIAEISEKLTPNLLAIVNSEWKRQPYVIEHLKFPVLERGEYSKEKRFEIYFPEIKCRNYDRIHTGAPSSSARALLTPLVLGADSSWARFGDDNHTWQLLKVLRME